ncbi:tryptophan synthase subunit alpha [Nitrincola alkalilacustris]|uniref:tryptophan synthase subunit alpha n=1 Tax=Nitrincola alkalilacustris TaxID=1571224 RepID=UPI00124EDF2B|nr:tryptophan synthase subunit alpha [Nitrincola alkalilacustris]
MNALTDFIHSKRKTGKRLLMTHVVFGYPSIEKSLEMMHLLLDSGVELLEVQFPFSDPVADGPAITSACHHALAHKPTLQRCIAELQALSEQYPDSRILLMSYLNPLLQFGFERLAELGNGIISGIIIPDLPVEHDALLAPLANSSITPIWLLTPDTPDSRLEQVVRKADGMIYCVSRKGVTGQQSNGMSGLDSYLLRVKALTDLPLGVGFGIQGADDIRSLPESAAIAIIGSGLLNAYNSGGLDRLQSLLTELQNA